MFKNKKELTVGACYDVRDLSYGTPLVAKRHVAAIKFAIQLNTLSSGKLSGKAYNMFAFDDAKGHYNWISLMTELFKRYKIEVSDSNFIIKKKVKSYFEESLKKKLTTVV